MPIIMYTRSVKLNGAHNEGILAILAILAGSTDTLGPVIFVQYGDPLFGRSENSNVLAL